MNHQNDVHHHLEASPLSRRERFIASRTWLVVKNVLGWLLILTSFVAGPLVPGPGGIPLFLIGFALISFPGKRRLTARVLRGKPVRFRRRPFLMISSAVALVVPVLVLMLPVTRSRWMATQYAGGSAAVLYLLGVASTWLVIWLLPRALNLLLRVIAQARQRVRPWLRRHRIRLLPPRWRRRHPHEQGHGPLRLKDEILRFYRKHHH